MSLALVQDKPSKLSPAEKVAAANRTLLAERVGLTRNYVSLVLGGKREPAFSVAKQLAEELGITLDQLYGCWSNVRKAA